MDAAPNCISAFDAGALETLLLPVLMAGSIQHILVGGVVGSALLYLFRFHERDVGPHHWCNARYLVGALLLLNAVQMAMTFDVTSSIVRHLDDDAIFEHRNWAICLAPGVVALLGCFAQLFLLDRTWRSMSTYKPRIAVCGMLMACVLLSFGSGLAVCVSFFRAHSFGVLTNSSTLTSVWVSSTAVTNLAIASVLVVAALAKGRPASFKPRPHAVVAPGCVFTRTAQLVVETGGLSAVVSVLNLILYYAEAGTAYHLLAEYAMGPLYTLTVLTALLARPAPERDAHHASSFALTGHMERGGSNMDLEVKARFVNTVVETDMPGGAVTEPRTGKLIWPQTAVVV
ncbi:hypothetical protein DFH08DRAFT_964481 [Mycena albidolilacea]|uniref:DUF6534 domain-containing protein n=1 Tax=Mycena albidolilacea TaxID=1033008 RepID=A0AAD7ELP4_9AGAR|nr:hypothetical protein DFH08DRAFT_964481 [Mycena albidolilacea]